MDLLWLVERHLRETGTPPSRFGRDALGDPGFVTGLRRGREPRDSTTKRVTAYLNALHRSARA